MLPRPFLPKRPLQILSLSGSLHNQVLGQLQGISGHSALDDKNSFYFTLVSENKVLLGAKEYNKDNDADDFVKTFSNLQQKALVETIDNLDTETDVTIYDSIVNQTLVLGAVYYIFFTTNGQINKLSSAYKLYSEKLDDIVKFYTSI